jgi:ParB family transcriptional regulator, chromosome partitioning protein
MKLAIADIRIGNRMRTLRENIVSELMDSIAATGLQYPITVMGRNAPRPGGGAEIMVFELIAGHHRLIAMQRLGYSEIEVKIVDQFDYATRLFEIEENLCRAELSHLERSEHLMARKKIYEELYPQTRAGAAQAAGMHRALGHQPLPQTGPDGAVHNVARNFRATFAADTAERIGVSADRVRRDVVRANKIDRKIRERIRDRLEIADNGKELDALAGLAPAEQKAAIDLVETGKAKTVRQARDLLAARNATRAATPERSSKRLKMMLAMWAKADESERQAFLDAIGRKPNGPSPDGVDPLETAELSPRK